MADRKRLWSTVAVAAFFCLVLGGTIGGMYWWDISRTDKQTATLEKSSKKTDAETEKEAEVKTPDGSYKGWLVYEDTAIGYTLKYPPDWTFTKSPVATGGVVTNYVTFNNDDKDYAFSFGLRKAGADTIISARTEPGAGTPEDGGSVKVLGQDVVKTYNVDNGRVSIVFYGVGLNGNFVVGDNEISAELRVPGYKDKSLKGSPQEAIADMIISSLELKS